MNKALLDRTPLCKIRPEEQVIPDINSLQVDNSREQAKLYYEANKVEIWENTLREKDKEIERLNNIIDEKDYQIRRIVYSCYESDMSYDEFKRIWVNAFGKLYDPKDIDKLENDLKGDDK